MKIYRIELEVKTPTIVVNKSLKNWYTAVSDIVPSRTFYGGLIGLLTSLGAKYEELVGKTNTSSLYPIVKEKKNTRFFHTYPAPPLSFKCKNIVGEYSEVKLFIWELASKIGKKNTGFDSAVASVYREVCRKMNFCSTTVDTEIDVKSCSFLKPVAGTPIYHKRQGEEDKYYESEGFRIIALESVGINPVTRSSEGGMVYTYEAIPPGTRMHGFIAVNNVLAEYIVKIKGEVMYLGRGTSRGYGLVEVKNVAELPDNIIDKPSNILISLSEVYPLQQNYILPTKIIKFISWSRLYGYLKPITSIYSPGTILYNPGIELEKILFKRPSFDFFIPLETYKKILNGEI